MVTLNVFNVFKLIDNPFSATPLSKEKQTIWAGREGIKTELINGIKTSLISSPSRIIVCWGEWGTGKTHSMRYFSQVHILSEISDNLKTKKGFPISIFCPRESVLQSLYRSIIRDIGLDTLRDIVKKVAYGDAIISAPRTQVTKIMEIGFSNTEAKIFQALIHGDPKLRSTAERYVFLEATGTDIKNLNVPERIRTKNEQIEFLGEIFRLLICPDSEYSRIFLWIDEMEHIDNFSGKDLVDLRSLIRSIIDIIPSGLTIFLIGTFKAGDEFEAFLDYLGPAIRDRLFKVIPLPYLEKDDAKVYVRTLLNNTLYRNPEEREMLESRGLEYFPFDENTIEYIYDKLSENLERKPTPRNLNDALTSALENCYLDEEYIKRIEKMETHIDSSFIDAKWDDIKIRFTGIL